MKPTPAQFAAQAILHERIAALTKEFNSVHGTDYAGVLLLAPQHSAVILEEKDGDLKADVVGSKHSPLGSSVADLLAFAINDSCAAPSLHELKRIYDEHQEPGHEPDLAVADMAEDVLRAALAKSGVDKATIDELMAAKTVVGDGDMGGFIFRDEAADKIAELLKGTDIPAFNLADLANKKDKPHGPLH